MRCYSCHKDDVSNEILRVMHFPVKYSSLCNKKGLSKPGFQNVAVGSIAETSELTVVFFFFTGKCIGITPGQKQMAQTTSWR